MPASLSKDWSGDKITSDSQARSENGAGLSVSISEQAPSVSGARHLAFSNGFWKVNGSRNSIREAQELTKGPIP